MQPSESTTIFSTASEHGCGRPCGQLASVRLHLSCEPLPLQNGDGRLRYAC